MVEMNFQMKSTQKTSLDAQFITGSDVQLFGAGAIFPERHFDHFCHSDGHETIHHSKEN